MDSRPSTFSSVIRSSASGPSPGSRPRCADDRHTIDSQARRPARSSRRFSSVDSADHGRRRSTRRRLSGQDAVPDAGQAPLVRVELVGEQTDTQSVNRALTIAGRALPRYPERAPRRHGVGSNPPMMWPVAITHRARIPSHPRMWRDRSNRSGSRPRQESATDSPRGNPPSPCANIRGDTSRPDGPAMKPRFRSVEFRVHHVVHRRG